MIQADRAGKPRRRVQLDFLDVVEADAGKVLLFSSRPALYSKLIILRPLSGHQRNQPQRLGRGCLRRQSRDSQ